MPINLLCTAAFVAVLSACRAAVIPNMMFAGSPLASGLSTNNNWRPSETYGYLDRHPMLSDAAILSVPTQPVYGIAHRYLSEPSPYAEPSHDLYSNPLFQQHRYGNSKRLSNYPNYDMAMEDDTPVPDYEPNISQQDVINFEKYVQRFFLHQQQQEDEQQQQDDTNQQYSDWSADEENPENYEEMNDEEAARQLHLLLNKNQQRRPIVATREIQKKSVGAPNAVETITTNPVTATQAAEFTTATPASVAQQHHHHSGQKEEPMLRPPTIQHPSSSPAPEVTKQQEKEDNNDIYHTLQRFINMRNQLQQEQVQ